jgi:hypothetical protein
MSRLVDDDSHDDSLDADDIDDGDDDDNSVGCHDDNSGRDKDVFAEAEETQLVAQNNDAEIVSRTQISKKLDAIARQR